ncbi:MAG: hypothetical protein A2Z16_11150 [Chloroflexi bacterium RBG_16_54_18]|nr:MAG: hypothetical protein A2Z16_11150 [Chloroflexi bacterium RBG_16_54_18]
MNKAIFWAIIFTFAFGCTVPEAGVTPTTVDLEVQAAGRPALGQPLILQVDRAGEKLDAEKLQLALPEGYELLSQQAIEADGKEFIVQPGQPGLSELVFSLKEPNPAQNSVYVYLGRPEGSKMQSPVELSAIIDPQPGLGKTLHVQAWAKTLVDSPNTTLEMRVPAGLSLAAGNSSISRDLAANETLELSADLLVEQQGEFPIEIEVLSKTSEDLFWGRKLTFYVQVGTPLGNTITEFSQAAIDSSNELQAEKVTPLPAHSEPAGTPKKEGWVEPIPVGASLEAESRPVSYPNPPEAVPFEVTISMADKQAETGLEKPPYLTDGAKQVPPDQPSGQSSPPPEIKPDLTGPVNTDEQTSAVGWNLMMTEGFEGAFPAGLWEAFDNNGSGNGEYYWDDDDYLPHTDSWSAWAARGGANGLDPQFYYYPDNMDSWMVYGPFDLSDCSEAEYNFYYWNQSEPNYDFFGWAASGNGVNFYGWELSGDQSSWSPVTFDLDSYCGDPDVWIMFSFISDSSNVDDGAFVDDIYLWKYVPPGPLEVHGYWYYLDKNLVDQPVPYGRVELYDVDPSGDTLLATTYTDPYGYYSATFTNNDLDDSGGVDLFVRVYSTDDYSVNVRTGGGGNTLYFGQTATVNNLPNGTYDEGGWTLSGSGVESFYIYDVIADDAWNFLINNTGWDNNYNLQVQWSPTSVVGTWYNGYIALVAGDRWDEDVILHEYGHFVMHRTYVTYPPSPNCNPHYWGAHSSLGCGWTEGWANFLQGAIQNSPDYVDTEDQTINYSLEPPYAWADHPEDEGAVAAGLWDVYDAGAESFDTIVNGIDGAAHDGIWDVVYNLDPVNVQGFWNGWGTSNNGYCPEVWSVFNHVAIDYDSSGPAAPPSLHSTTHTVGAWSNVVTLSLAWNVPADGCGSGVAGYSSTASTSPSTIPDATIDTTATNQWWGMVNGSWYLHVRAVDNSGNAGGTSHLGPFNIDLTAPNNPTSVWSSDHTVGAWSSDATISMGWSGASDALSGVYAYSYEFSTSNSTLPDTTWDTTGTSTTSASLTESNNWYFHIRTRDVAGNYTGDAVHSGPYMIDFYAPTNPTSTSPNCAAANNTWQNTCADPNFTWSGAADSASGVAGYFYYWGSDPNGTSANYTTSAGYNPGAVSNPSTNYMRVQTKDYAGFTASWVTLFTFKYDTEAPNSAVNNITTLVPGASYQVSWAGSDSGSGLVSYDVQYRVGAGGAWTDWLSATTSTSTIFGPTSPLTPVLGETYYFRCRARDALGNLEPYPAGADLYIQVTANSLVFLPVIMR